MKRNVGILIYDNTEVLDFAGPFEVFAVTSQINNHRVFDVFTIAKTKDPVIAVNGLSINPSYSFEDVPKVDILIISGGDGSNQFIKDEESMAWVQKIQNETELTLSICSGARILGKLGLLDHQPYSTHHLVYDNLAELVPSGKPMKTARFVDNNKILTSGGISAGIDLSLYVIKKLLGNDMMVRTASYMEYILNTNLYE